ncbi:MAG: ABC transporter substrate-binding protein, partial [Bdellovibrionota bacterium]
SPSSFNPQLAADGASYNATRMVYDRLVAFVPGKTEVKAGLAESWKISKNGLSYVFKLRKGVKFHTTPKFKPTRDFNADDVIFSFDRQRLKDHPFHGVGGGNYEYFSSMEMGETIKDIRKVDDLTVEFTLSRPDAPFIANLAMEFTSILSAEYGAAMLKAGTPDQVDTDPIGTGPFVFGEYVKDNTIRYSAFSEYWAGRSPLDKVVFAITTDANVRYQKLKAGECHLVSDPSPSDIENIKKDSKLSLVSGPGMNVAYLGMNVNKKPFDQVLVRQAINHALNKASYIEAIYLGNARVAKNPLPPTIWSYNDKVTDYAYDPAKAKELLAKAGFPTGFDIELWTMPVSRPYNPNGKKMGEMMQADLAKVGVRAKLVTYDWPTYLQKAKDGEHSVLQMGWTGDNGDPDNFLQVLLGCAGVKAGSNAAQWCDPQFDEMTKKAKSLSNVAERTKLYEKAQLIFKAQAPWVTLAHSTVYRAMRANVTGYVL